MRFRAKKGVKRKTFFYFDGTKMASKAETVFATTLDDEGIEWEYEPTKFPWVPPTRKYTPDFMITKKDGTEFYVEYKGYLRPGDRTKMRAIKKQYPDLDIRFIFMKANKPLYKGSKTEYWMWAEQWGFPWAEKEIPEEWL